MTETFKTAALADALRFQRGELVALASATRERELYAIADHVDQMVKRTDQALEEAGA